MLFYFKDKQFSFQETNSIANRWANGYQSSGVKRGDKVTAILPNSPEFIFHWFGLAKLGGGQIYDSSIYDDSRGDTENSNRKGGKV